MYKRVAHQCHISKGVRAGVVGPRTKTSDKGHEQREFRMGAVRLGTGQCRQVGQAGWVRNRKKTNVSRSVNLM